MTESNTFHPSSKSQTKAPSLSPPTNEFSPLESKYWLKKYALGNKATQSTKAKSSTITTISNSIIQGISFGIKNSEDKIAVATGPRVCIKDIRSLDKIEKYLSFTGPVYCVKFREGDGRVLALGGENGLVRIVDLGTRATLRTFQSGNHTIRCLNWLRDGKRLIAGSDDGRIYLWDLTQDLGMDIPKPKVFIGHGDSVRDVIVWKNKIVSGSYDHTIRIWDLEGNMDNILYLDGPVEALCLIPDNSIASVSNVSLYIHDLQNGEYTKSKNTYHAKTITSVSYYHDEEEGISRIITGGIDGFIRIHDLTLTTLHGTSVSCPISTISFHIPKQIFLIGTSTGTLLSHSKTTSITVKKRKIEPMKGTYSYFFRTNKPNLSSDDIIILPVKKKQHNLHKYDDYLRKFQYTDALNDAFFNHGDKTSISLLLQELAKRNAITVALSNRDKSTVIPIMNLLTKHISDVNHSSVFVSTAKVLLEIYEDVGKGNEFDKSFRALKFVVEREVVLMRRVRDDLAGVDCGLSFLSDE